MRNYLMASGRNRTRGLAVVLAVFIAVVELQVMQFNSTASAVHVDPVEIDAAYWDDLGLPDNSNPTCSDIDDGAWEWKWEDGDLSDGTHTGSWGPWDLRYDISWASGEPKLVNWESSVGIFSVFIKSGTDKHLYYQYPDGSPKTVSGYAGFDAALLYGDAGLVAQEGRGISHISFCLPNELQVTKTAETSYDSEYDWDITKNVDIDEQNLFDGQTGTSTYTVELTKTGPVDFNHAVSGTITIVNPTPFDMFGYVFDEVAGTFGPIPTSCDPVVIVPAFSTVDCTYAGSINPGDSVNTATVIPAEFTEPFALTPPTGGSATEGSPPSLDIIVATADVIFGAPTNVFNDTVDVTDVFVGPPTVVLEDNLDHSAIFTYTHDFPCIEGSGGGEFDNAASFKSNDTNLAGSAGQIVTVTCYVPTIEKTVTNTDYTRTFDWGITKVADPIEHNLFTGQSGTSDYKVVVTKDAGTDNQFEAGGSITINNSNPSLWLDSTLLDEDANFISTNVIHIAPGGSQTIIWKKDDGNTDPGLTSNEASFVLFAQPYSDTVSYSYGGPTTLVNDQINVSDSHDGAGALVAGALPGGTTSSSNTYTYSLEFDCNDDEGSHKNTASFTSDTDSGSVDAIIHVACYGLTVVKTEKTSLTRTHDWSIDKAVDQAAPFVGEDVTYTIDVAYDGAVDSDWKVAGTITVTNNHPSSIATGVVLDDLLVGIDGLVLGDIAPLDGATITGYSEALDGNDTTNTATATLFSTEYDSNTVNVEFGDNADEINEIDDKVTVSDPTLDLSENFVAPVGGSFGDTVSYDATGTYSNTASVGEDSLDDPGDPAENTDTVTVIVYDISVAKTADSSLTRTHDWSVVKTVNQNAPFVGEQITYTVTTTYDGFIDSDHAIEGNITVTNNHPTRKAKDVVLNDALLGITDLDLDDIDANGGTSVTPYGPSSVPSSTTINTATATLFSTDDDGSAALNLSGTADTINEIDDEVTTTDLNFGDSANYTADIGGGSFTIDVTYLGTGEFSNRGGPGKLNSGTSGIAA